jgi:hypothetical protein
VQKIAIVPVHQPNAKELAMSRMHATCLAIVIFLLSTVDATAQHGRARHSVLGGHPGSGAVHHRGHWASGYPVYGYPVWDGYGYGYGSGYYSSEAALESAAAGAYLQGLGAYELYDAAAGAINAETFMKLNQYDYLSRREAEYRYGAKRREHFQHLASVRKAIDERLVFDPTDRDIHVGDALNAATAAVKRHKPFRKDPGLIAFAIPRNCFENLTFTIPAESVRINPRELSEPDQWPIGLRDDRYAPERNAYESAIKRIFVEAANDGVTPRTLRQIDGAVARLRAKLENDPPPALAERAEARSHVQVLAATAKTLHHGQVGEILTDLELGPPQTLVALIGFMNKHQLRFGAAQTARQRQAHQDLHTILARGLDKAVEDTKGDGRIAMVAAGDEGGDPR